MNQNDTSFMDDFSLQESQFQNQSFSKKNVRNLNKEFEKIKTDEQSEEIESFKENASKQETSMKLSQDIKTYKSNSKVSS